MGNKNNVNNKNNSINQEKKNKSFTLCPLINKRKLIKEKKTVGNTVSSLGVINYNNNDFILIGFDYGKIEIFDSVTLESVAADNTEINSNEYIRYVGQLLNENIVIVSQDFVRIYAFYLDNLSSNEEEGHNCYNIKLLQKINSPFESEYTNKYINVEFSKAFFFDRNLYREYDLYEMQKDKDRRKKDPYYKGICPIDEELIISSHEGIFIYEKINTEENNEEKQAEEHTYSEENENEKNNNKFDIYSHLEKWEKNPYVYKRKITGYDNYDMIQVNFRYIAGTIQKYLCLYSMETYELVTKFSVKISENCDSVIFMLKEDILCVAGDDTISLISIKNIEVILVTLIKEDYRITEICILPDYNILIGMQNKGKSFNNYLEYFYQYKCFHKVNKITKNMEYDILKVSSKLLTKNYSNITMRCLSNGRLVTVIDLELIQVWE